MLFSYALASPMSWQKCMQWQKWWIWLKKIIIIITIMSCHTSRCIRPPCCLTNFFPVSCNCFGYFPALLVPFFLLFLNSPSPSRFWSSSCPVTFICPWVCNLTSSTFLVIHHVLSTLQSVVWSNIITIANTPGYTFILISDLSYCRWTWSKMMERSFILIILKVDLLLYLCWTCKALFG